MSPDTNNNVGNEENDENTEDEDEPVFKYSPIASSSGLRKHNDGNKNTPSEFCCMAIHHRFIIIGTPTGEILIIDHLGHINKQFEIKAHSYPVNAVTVDDNGEYIGSCCQEGKVKISGLFTKNDDQLITFPRPVKAVCLNPNFSRAKLFVTGDTNLVLNEKGAFGRHKTTKLQELPNGGLIHTLRWKEMLIAFANDSGVGVYDLRARRLVGFVPSTDNKESQRGLFQTRMSWSNSSVLAIAYEKTIKLVSIVTDPNSDNPSVASKVHMNIIASYQIEFYACGLTSVNRDLVILGIESYTQSDGTLDPSLTVLVPTGKSHEEKAHDPFSMYRERDTLPFQFQLEYLPDEQCFFILNPFDIIKAERRDYDDHIDYLIEKGKYRDAIKAFENPKGPTDKTYRHTQQTVYQAYVNSLISDNKIDEAVELFSYVYKTPNEWEEQILLFIQRNQIDKLAAHIPTEKIVLNRSIYEQVLRTFLTRKKYEKLKESLIKWPSEIYDINSIEQAIRLEINDENTAKDLLECSAIIAEKLGNVSKTLDIYLKMKNAQIFQLIERKQVFNDILPHINELMIINKNTAIDLLIRHMDRLSVRSVHDALKKDPRNLHAYLDAVFSKNPNDSRDFHTLQVELYADYEPSKLMSFLRKAGNYNLQDALAICDKRQLYRETVFLYGRAGNGQVALRIILKELKNIEEAIEFCRQTGDQTLWTMLIEESKDKPEFIRGLLNHAGSDINLKQLIDKIRNDLKIPGLCESLCKIMQDYNIQMSLSECCRKIIVNDCLALRKRTMSLLESGYLVKDSDLCAKCHSPLYNPDIRTNPPISVFFCLHVFHSKCIEQNLDVCGVCSTSSLFTSN